MKKSNFKKSKNEFQNRSNNYTKKQDRPVLLYRKHGLMPRRFFPIWMAVRFPLSRNLCDFF